MIRWLKLLNNGKLILESYGIKANIEIHLSTALPDDVRANVQGTSVKADILLSALHNKTEDDVVESMAHELAHIVCHKNKQLDAVTVQADIHRKLKEALNA